MLKLVRRPDSPYWQIVGTIRGIRIRESAGTHSRPHAEAILARRQQEILDRAVYGARATATWAEAVNLYLDRSGEARYLAPLVERWGPWPLAAITPLEVARAGREIYPGCSPSTLRRQIYTPLIAVLNCAAEAGLCPEPKITPPTVRHRPVVPASDAYIAAVLQDNDHDRWPTGSRGAARHEAARTRLRALILLLTTTGARISEAVGLTWRHVDLDRREAILLHTKNGRAHRLALAPALVEALAALPRGAPDEPVLGYRGRRSASQAIERAARLAGLPQTGSHALGRHAFAARMLANGSTLREVQRAGNWADITIVARHYGHLEQSAVDSAVRAAATNLTRALTAPPSNVLPLRKKP